MKIGFDLRSVDLASGGGISNYGRNLLENLLKIDQENKYILFNNRFSPQVEKFNDLKIQSFRYPNKAFNFSQKFFNYPKIDHLLKGVDLFFSPNILFTAISGTCKHVVCAHDISFKLFPEFLSSKRKAWHYFVNPQKMYTQADKIIAVSENTKNDLINNMNISPDKIKVIYSGINIHNPASEELDQIKEKYILPDKFILTLSVLEPRKNISSLITAFQELNLFGYKLIIAGRRGWKDNQILKQIKNNPNILFLENISDKEKFSLYKLASLFVFPSFYEGFGFPPLEAMSQGSPIVASLNSSISEICGEQAILIDPYNIYELKQGIKEGLKKEKNNFNIEEKFNWERTARETLSLFSEILR